MMLHPKATAIIVTAASFARLHAAEAPGVPSKSNEWVENAALVYDGAVVSDVHGGLAPETKYVGNLHLRNLIDLERAWGWRGSHLFVDAVWIHGGQPDRAVGDALGVDNLTGPPGLQPDELWVEKNLGGERLSALVGLYDLNSEFYHLQSSALFVNSAFGVGPEFAQSGAEGPSTFPRTAVGARVAYKPAPNVVLRAAVFDGVPLIRGNDRYGLFESGDGLLYLGEIALLDRPASVAPAKRRNRIGRNAGLPPYEGKLAVGAWRYTAAFERVDPSAHPGRQRGSSGFYAIGDRIVGRRATDDSRTVSLFAEVGFADAEVNRFGRFLAAGLVAVGPLASRTEDELGVAVATVRNGAPYMRANALANPARSETVIELSYLAHLASWLAVQPDVQYVINPDTTHSVGDAVVVSLRFEISIGSK